MSKLALGGGIDIFKGSENTVSNNMVRATPHAGISIFDSTNNVITANMITATQGGIVITSNSNFNLVAGNTLVDGFGAGIALSGSPSESPSYNVIQGDTVLHYGQFDLMEVGSGVGNIWRLIVFTTKNSPTLD